MIEPKSKKLSNTIDHCVYNFYPLRILNTDLNSSLSIEYSLHLKKNYLLDRSKDNDV